MDEASRQVEWLYRQHGQSILRYLRRLSPDVDEAEDLLQETFAEAMKRIEHLMQANSPRAWLFGIARHLGHNALRRRRPHAPLPEQLPEQLASPTAADGDERVERMRGQIAALPEAMREALQLRLQDELTYEEIATVLEIPLGTVRSRLHSAVRQLRQALVGEQQRE